MPYEPEKCSHLVSTARPIFQPKPNVEIAKLIVPSRPSRTPFVVASGSTFTPGRRRSRQYSSAIERPSPAAPLANVAFLTSPASTLPYADDEPLSAPCNAGHAAGL